MPLELKKAWDGVIRPMLKRPDRFQVAALCHKGDGSKKKILLVTSLDSGRWILPKGWPIDGKSAAESAVQEAWEEAGVRLGRVHTKAIGSYTYQKGLKSGLSVPCKTKVFPVEVTKLDKDYPEANERRRKWVTPAEAANMVNEPELRELLSNL